MYILKLYRNFRESASKLLLHLNYPVLISIIESHSSS